MNRDNEMDERRAGEEGAAATFFKGRALLVTVALCALYVATRLWRLDASCLWFDEIFSVHAARHEWGRMLHFVAADIIHPPLFYALLKVWMGVGGESLFWLRLFPAATSIAAIVPFLLLCRELRLTTGETHLALLLMSVNGYLIKYAQELRMYSLLLFLTICSLWLFVRYARTSAMSRRPLLALTVVNLLLVYTHYYGWLVVALQVFALLCWRREKLSSYASSAGALLLAYAPWVYEVMSATRVGEGLGQNIGWVARPRLAEVTQYLALLNKPFVFSQSNVDALNDLWSVGLSLLLFGGPLVALAWRAFVSRQDERGARLLRALLLFSFVPALAVLLLSWLMPYSVWGTRHLIIAAAPYSILAALALTRLRPQWMKITLALIIGCWFSLAGALLLVRREPVFIWCAWEQLAGQMLREETGATQAASVYAYEDLVAYHLWFALSQTGAGQFRVAVIKNVPGLLEDPAYFLPRDFDEVAVHERLLPEENRFWVAFRAAEWDETRPPLDMLEGAGFRVARRLETSAQGQQAFLVQLVRER